MNMDNEKDKMNPQEPEETSAQEESAIQAEPAAEPKTDEVPASDEKPEEASEKDEAPEQPETDGGENKEEKPESHKVKEYLGSERFKHGGISTAFTVGFLAVVILINVIVGILGQRFPSMNLDLTKNNSNTLSEQAVKVVDGVKEPVKVYILATEDQVKNDQIMSEYGLQYSQVGVLAAKMQERNSNIQVQYIDLVKNPTFANEYKSENLAQGDVLITSSKRNRVLTYSDLFSTQYGQDGSQETYSLVDSALASGVNSVVAENMPVVAFDTGHGEQIDTTTYKQLLANNSFETKDFNILTDAVPDKAQMIVLGCPATDYTDAEITKLDDFLSSTKIAGDRSLMVTFHPSQKEMPKLSAFLMEWGIEVPQAVIVESDQSKMYTNDASYILSNVGTDLTLNDKTDYGYFLTPQSNPINLLFQSKGNKVTYSLAKSNDTSYLADNNTKSSDNPPKQAYNTAVLSQDTVDTGSGNKPYKANVIALGSSVMFESQILAANTYGNGKFVVDLSKYATGTSDTATAVTSTSVQTNVADITLSTQMSTLLGFGVFTVLIPLLIAIAGIVVFRKRRHL